MAIFFIKNVAQKFLLILSIKIMSFNCIPIFPVGVIGRSDSSQEVSARKLDGSEQVITKGGISLPGLGDSNNPPLTPEPPLSTISPQLPTTELYGNQGTKKILPSKQGFLIFN